VPRIHCFSIVRTSLSWMLDRILTALGILLYRLGLAGILIRLHRHAPKVLMYHAFEEVESDFTRGLEINTTPREFAAHLEFLRARYNVVPLEELLEGTSRGPAVAITIDDGFRSIFTGCWPLLQEFGIPATCYLTAEVLSGARLIWVNELAWFLRRSEEQARPIVAKQWGLAPSLSVERILQTFIEHYDPAAIESLLVELRQAVGIDPARDDPEGRILHLSWDEVAIMAAGGISFGNHTATHPPLAKLPDSACRDEITRGAAALAGLPGAIPSLAYPFGSRTEQTRRIALECGMTSLLEVEGVNHPWDPTRIGRIKVESFGPDVLFARMEVVEPVKAWLQRLLNGGRPRMMPVHRGH